MYFPPKENAQLITKKEMIFFLILQCVKRSPISRTCQMLGIGRNTYYQKLEWLYRCCLEKYEKRVLPRKEFNEIWLNTDKMTYYLNNVRKKGQGGKGYLDLEDKQFPTNVVVTADVHSRYVFRSDVSNHWEVFILSAATF
jgi:hypothetical protein